MSGFLCLLPKDQGKTKGQQLKGKIVSEVFALFRTFSHFFRIFPPGLSPSKQKVLAQGEQKRRKDNKKNRTNRCCTLVVARFVLLLKNVFWCVLCVSVCFGTCRSVCVCIRICAHRDIWTRAHVKRSLRRPLLLDRFKGGANGKGSICAWLPVHCLYALADRQLYCHTSATSHSLRKHDQIARDNRFPVQ